MERLTVMVIPDRSNATVRRFSLSVRRLKRAALLAVVGVLTIGVGSVDYVRARRDTRELSGLRQETAAQRDRLAALDATVARLQDRLDRVRELERKVRIIADLPQVSEQTVAPAGLGGGRDEESLPEIEPEGAPPAEESAGAGAGAREGAPPPDRRAALDAAGMRAAHVARIHATADALDERAVSQATSLAELVERLEGKSRRLASTPSIWPTRGWVTSGYGYRTSPFTGNRQFHGGIDVASKPGTPVISPAQGVVVFAGRKGPLGRTVILDHGYGIRTTYGHNAKLFVKKGERVERGDPIAAVGSSGRSTGPHLHYAVQVDGRLVNPMNYILDE